MRQEELPAPLLDSGDPALSLYIPLDPAQRDIRQPEAQLREMLEKAEASLHRWGLDQRRAAEAMAPLKAAVRSLDLAIHRDPGLAFFLEARSGMLHRMVLPYAPALQVAVGRHFQLRPLLPLLSERRHFWLLTLNGTRVRLLRGTRRQGGLTEVDLGLAPPMPAGAAAAQPAQSSESGVAPGTEAGGFPGGEPPPPYPADPQRIVQAVKAAIGRGDTAPILLAAEPRTGGHFRKAAHLPALHPEMLVLNPEAFDDATLRARALELLKPVLDRERAAVMERITARLGAAQADVAIRLEEILAAAETGRVDALLVAEGETLWGRFAPGQGVIAHGSPSPGDEDLLNLAAVATLRNGGRVFALPAERIPRDAPAAAALRY
jgi:hypothetical protein